MTSLSILGRVLVSFFATFSVQSPPFESLSFTKGVFRALISALLIIGTVEDDFEVDALEDFEVSISDVNICGMAVTSGKLVGAFGARMSGGIHFSGDFSENWFTLTLGSCGAFGGAKVCIGNDTSGRSLLAFPLLIEEFVVDTSSDMLCCWSSCISSSLGLSEVLTSLPR